MSTFGKSTSRRITQFEAFDDTPGPTAYDPAVALSLLNQDPNKHYGFLEKSTRWKSLSKDTLNENEGEEYEAELMSSTGSNRSSSIHRKDHLMIKSGEKEEIAKLKKEMERMQCNFEKQNTLHEKEMLMVGERCVRLDSLLQAALKEKNNLSSTTAKKDKEIDELMRKQDVLRINLEKAEKASQRHREKQLESDILQKKVLDLSKKQEKYKSLAKSSAEVESIQQELKSARSQLSTLNAEKSSLAGTIDQLKTERKSFKTKSVELAAALSSMKEEWSAREAKYKEETKEMAKRLSQQEEKLCAQKEDFKKNAEDLYHTCTRQKKELENEKSSFEHQKQAYLSRINQLESDLEVTERGLIDKDRQLDQLRESTISLQENTFKTEKSISEFQKQLFAVQEERNEYKSRCLELEEKRRELELVFMEKEKEQAHFEALILSLQSTIDQYQAEHEAMVSDHAHNMGAKEQIISNLTTQLNLSDKEMKLLAFELCEKKTELEGLLESRSSLSSRLEELQQSSTQHIQSLEEALNDTKKQLLDLEKSSEEEMERRQSMVASLEAKWNLEADNYSKQINMLKLDKSDIQQRLIEAQQALHFDQERSSEQASKLYAEIENYQEKIKALGEDYENLMKSKEAAAADFHDAMTELEARFENEANSADYRMADYTRKISRLQAEIEDLNATISENTIGAQQMENNLKTEIDILEKSLEKNKVELSAISLQYDQSQNTLKSLDDYHKSEKNSSSVQIQRLHREVSEKESANEKLRLQIKDLESKLAEEIESVQILKSNHSRNRSEIESRLLAVEHDLKTTEAELVKSQASYVDANNHVLEVFAKLIAIRSEYYSSLELLSTLQGESVYQNIDIDYLDSELKSCQMEACEIKIELEAEKSSKKEFEELLVSTQNALIDLQVDQEDCNHNESALLYAQIMKFQEENDCLQNIVSKMSLRNLQLEFDLAIAQNDLENYEMKLKEQTFKDNSSRKILATGVANSMDLAASLWDQLEDANLIIEESNEAFKNEKETRKNLEIQLKDVNAHLASVEEVHQATIISFQKDIELLKAELLLNNKKVEELQENSSSLEIELKSAEVDKQKLLEDVEIANSKVDACNQNIGKLEVKLKESDIAIEQLSENSSKQLQMYERDIEKLKAENIDLQQKLTDESVAVADLNAAYIDSQQEIAKLNKDIFLERSLLNAKTQEAENFQRKSLDQSEKLSELLNHIDNNEQTIEMITSQKKELDMLLIKERSSFETEKSSLIDKHLVIEKELNQSVTSLNEKLHIVEDELKTTIHSRDEQTKAMNSQIEILQGKFSDVESAYEEKEAQYTNLLTELSRAKLEHEAALVELKAKMDSQEKLFNETKYQLQTEKTEAMRNALSEKEELNAKVDVLSSELKTKDRKAEEYRKMNEQYESELQRIKLEGKQEFGTLQAQISEMMAKSEEESHLFEKTVQDMSRRLAEKNSIIHQMKSDLAEAHNLLERSEIRISNEVSNRELIIKSLEGKVKEQKKELDRIQLSLESSRIEQKKLAASIESSVAERMEFQIQAATKDLARENTELQRQLEEREHDESAFMKEIDRLQILLQEARQNQINEKENFDLQLQLLEKRGKLQANEIKKIGDLNAELFGHSNSRQKIKHVAQLKEENMNLREQSLGLSRERDVANRRILNLERELETFRSVGLFNNKKISRVGRSFQQSTKHNQSTPSEKTKAFNSYLTEGVDKENSLNMSLTGSASGGLSFIVE